MRRVITVVLIAALIVPCDAFAKRSKKRRAKRNIPTATAIIVWDVQAKRALYAKNALHRVYPASTTKVMTALLALEKLSLDKQVKVSRAACNVPETKLGVVPGETYRVRDLLYAILLKSANDGANVLAEAVSGSQQNFVALMNSRAKQLGAMHTRFSNAHGLPSNGTQYTTAKDMAIIFQQALKNPEFRRIISYKYHIIYSSQGRRFFLKSHNRSLFLNWKKRVEGKTGYTRQAQTCFVGRVQDKGRILIVAVFGSRTRWEDVKLVLERYGKVDL